MNFKNYTHPNYIDFRITRFFSFLFRICVPIYEFRIIWNFIIFYVELSETLISTLKPIYGELWNIVRNLIFNLLREDCRNCQNLRYLYFEKIFYKDIDLFPYFDFFIRNFKAYHPMVYYFYSLNYCIVRGMQNQWEMYGDRC
jgi:hypothetical protein